MAYIFPILCNCCYCPRKGVGFKTSRNNSCNQYLMLTILKLSIHELLGNLQNTSPGETSQMLVTCFLHCITFTNWVLSANSIHLTTLTCMLNRIHRETTYLTYTIQDTKAMIDRGTLLYWPFHVAGHCRKVFIWHNLCTICYFGLVWFSTR